MWFYTLDAYYAKKLWFTLELDKKVYSNKYSLLVSLSDIQSQCISGPYFYFALILGKKIHEERDVGEVQRKENKENILY